MSAFKRTVWWQVDIALASQEVVALSLALELGGELLGGDLRETGLATGRLVALDRYLSHICFVIAH